MEHSMCGCSRLPGLGVNHAQLEVSIKEVPSWAGEAFTSSTRTRFYFYCEVSHFSHLHVRQLRLLISSGSVVVNCGVSLH